MEEFLNTTVTYGHVLGWIAGGIVYHFLKGFTRELRRQWRMHRHGEWSQP
jgi:hypothetical protein